MKTTNSRPVVLCLSGHDPSGGAGLQADIEALIAQGCHAAPAVTALTVQDTVNVSDFRVLDRDWVLAQANAVIADLPVAAVKLGMLGSVQMVETVLEIMQSLPGVPLVCDPVLRAGGGGALGKDEVGYAIRERLLPVAAIATPNLPEARILAELPEGTSDECAEKLLPFCHNLLITGGYGPMGNGAFGADIISPSNYISTARGWEETRPIAGGLYRLPPGYTIAGGTSTATPTAAGAVALLISAARQSGIRYDAFRIRPAHRYLF